MSGTLDQFDITIGVYDFHLQKRLTVEIGQRTDLYYEVTVTQFPDLAFGLHINNEGAWKFGSLNKIPIILLPLEDDLSAAINGHNL